MSNLTMSQDKITAAMKTIQTALAAAENDHFKQYKIRNFRYDLLKANGIKCRRTYPKVNEEMKFIHVRPVRIVRHGGMSLGSKGQTRMVTC